MRIFKYAATLLLGLALGVGWSVFADQLVSVQGTAPSGSTARGNPVAVGGVDVNGIVRSTPVGTDGSLTVKGSSGAAFPPPGLYLTNGAPAATVSTSAVSASASGLTASACYRLACSAATSFRSGSGVVTALTTDAGFYGPGVEKICLKSTDTVMAFVLASGTGTCTLTRLTDGP